MKKEPKRPGCRRRRPEPAGPEARAPAVAGRPADAVEDLDRYETGVYLCRWPNGEFSVATADSKRDAILALDEFGPVEPGQLFPIDRFMADFRLSDAGEIVLNQFGEEASDAIWDKCYPALGEVLYQIEGEEASDEAGAASEERIRQAVEYERTRQRDDQPGGEASTEIGRRLAEQMGTSAVVADQYVADEARRILGLDDDEDGTPF